MSESDAFSARGGGYIDLYHGHHDYATDSYRDAHGADRRLCGGGDALTRVGHGAYVDLCPLYHSRYYFCYSADDDVVYPHPCLGFSCIGPQRVTCYVACSDYRPLTCS